MHLAIVLHAHQSLPIDRRLFTDAFEAIANAASIQVIRELGFKPEYVNLRPEHTVQDHP
jgi:transcriptional regulator of met regulon